MIELVDYIRKVIMITFHMFKKIEESIKEIHRKYKKNPTSRVENNHV